MFEGICLGERIALTVINDADLNRSINLFFNHFIKTSDFYRNDFNSTIKPAVKAELGKIEVLSDTTFKTLVGELILHFYDVDLRRWLLGAP